uniref:Uncharacterized protein n=1 Tax=Alexandrium catenella TaxID=2925 RepID=A0A7S1L8L2_ALECA
MSRRGDAWGSSHDAFAAIAGAQVGESASSSGVPGARPPDGAKAQGNEALGDGAGSARALMQHCKSAFSALEARLDADTAEARGSRMEELERRCETLTARLAAREAELEKASSRIEDIDVREALIDAQQIHFDVLGEQLSAKEAELQQRGAELADLQVKLESRIGECDAQCDALAAELLAQKSEMEQTVARLGNFEGREVLLRAREQMCEVRELELKAREQDCAESEVREFELNAREQDCVQREALLARARDLYQ